MKKINFRNNTTLMAFGSILSIIVLLLSSFAISGVGEELTIGPSAGPLLFGSFIGLALSRINTSLKPSIKDKKEKIRLWSSASLCLVCGVLAILVNFSEWFMRLSATIFFVAIIASRIFIIVREHKKIRTWVTNLLIVIILFLFTLVIIFTKEYGAAVACVLAAFVMTANAFIDVFSYVFINIKKSILLEILRKSYALEIILGLLTLIVSFSIILLSTESGFNNYGDALWYCFAIVTTIGFGDFTCVTIIGRILSVILGIYGIIVVALITSIIVNFYNETSKETKKTVDKIDKNVEQIKADMSDNKNNKKGEK